MFIKKIFLPASIVLLSLAAGAQTVKVQKETARVKGENADGYEVELEGAKDEVEASLTKYLKQAGKGKQNDDIIVISMPVIGGRSYTSPLYATTKDKGKTSIAWIGIKASEWTSADEVKKDIEKMVRDFGVNFCRDRIQGQIDESNRALQAVEKQQQRLLNQNKDLTFKLDDNRREKVQLEKSLENNKLELEALTKKLEKNKKDQDSVALAGEQIKKVVEMHKERQRKVN
ncbi:MAG: hypothetical protein ACOYXT_07455 [Bacteroidota bacterium]